MNDFTLRGERLLVLIKDPDAVVTTKGIIMPAGTVERFVNAIVFKKSDSVAVANEDDTILMDRHCSLGKISIGEETYQLIRPEDVIAVFVKDN